jgi:hypothetical protein
LFHVSVLKGNHTWQSVNGSHTFTPNHRWQSMNGSRTFTPNHRWQYLNESRTFTPNHRWQSLNGSHTFTSNHRWQSDAYNCLLCLHKLSPDALPLSSIVLLSPSWALCTLYLKLFLERVPSSLVGLHVRYNLFLWFSAQSNPACRRTMLITPSCL